jgi:hypothetical protein
VGLLSRPTAFPPGDLAARDAASGATEGGAESLLRLTVACIALVAVAGYVATYTHYLDIHAYPVIRSDGVGYYSYLPAWFIEHDATLRTFVALGHAGPRPDWVGLQQLSNGNYLNRYQIGEAVMLLPFFFAGHGIALLAGLNAGGFSGPEQLATGLGGLVYMVAGLAVLGRALRSRFSLWRRPRRSWRSHSAPISSTTARSTRCSAMRCRSFSSRASSRPRDGGTRATG